MQNTSWYVLNHGMRMQDTNNDPLKFNTLYTVICDKCELSARIQYTVV